MLFGLSGEHHTRLARQGTRDGLVVGLGSTAGAGALDIRGLACVYYTAHYVLGPATDRAGVVGREWGHAGGGSSRGGVGGRGDGQEESGQPAEGVEEVEPEHELIITPAAIH